MKKLICLSIISIFAFCFSFTEPGNHASTATFIFKSVGYKMDSNVTGDYNRVKIVVNGVNISAQDKSYKIRISAKGPDTIKLSSNRDYFNQTIIAKLKAGETYSFKFNPCSFFEIIPSVKKEERTRLVRIISVNRDTTKLFLDPGECLVDEEQINTKDTTDYYVNHYIGYCPYSASQFYLCRRIQNAENRDADYKFCKRTTIYFADNEMYSIIYDYKEKTMKVKFEGYYNEKMNIRIAEPKEE